MSVYKYITHLSSYVIADYYVTTEFNITDRHYANLFHNDSMGFKYDENKNLIEHPENIKHICDFNIIQCHNTLIDYFTNNILPQLGNKKIILFTSQKDLPDLLPNNSTEKLLNNKSIVLWISTNPIYDECLGFPYGINANKINEYVEFIKNNNLKKEVLISNLPCKPHYHLPETHIRKKYEIFGVESGNLEYKEFLTLIAKSKYCISTTGDRIDTMRHLECIGLGTIPISEEVYKQIYGDNILLSNPNEMMRMLKTNGHVLELIPETVCNRELITTSYWCEKITTNLLDNIFKNLGYIEKKIHITWKDKNILNSEHPLILNGVANMKKLNPEYNIVISDDNDVEQYLKYHLSDTDYDNIRNKHIVEKTDLWRLLKIYNEGGVYIDIDRLCNIPLSSIIKPGVKQVLPIYMHNGYPLDFSQDIIISCSKNPIIKAVIDLNLDKRKNIKNISIVDLGPTTYLEAISRVFLTGKHIVRCLENNKYKEQFDIIQYHLKKCQYLDTYLEQPEVFDTIVYQGPPVDNKKFSFYNKYGVIHHTCKN